MTFSPLRFLLPLCLAFSICSGQAWGDEAPAPPPSPSPAAKESAAVRDVLKENARDRERERERERERKSDVGEILDSMGYPELQVVPRASDRLLMEARSEDYNWYYIHWPVEVSGLATLFTGLTTRSQHANYLNGTEKTDANTVASITTAVGAGWLAGGLILGSSRPYRRGLGSISKYNGKDERSQLMRERLAEEALEQEDRTMQVVKYFSVLSNVTVDGLTIYYSNPTGRITAGVATILAFLPMMFEDHTIEIWDKHLEYKRKIYTPIRSASFHYEPLTKTFTPMSTLTWMF